MLKKLEAVRRSADGKILFYLLLGAIVGMTMGLLFSPKYMGCFNGCGNTVSGDNN